MSRNHHTHRDVSAAGIPYAALGEVYLDQVNTGRALMARDHDDLEPEQEPVRFVPIGKKVRVPKVAKPSEKPPATPSESMFSLAPGPQQPPRREKAPRPSPEQEAHRIAWEIEQRWRRDGISLDALREQLMQAGFEHVFDQLDEDMKFLAAEFQRSGVSFYVPSPEVHLFDEASRARHELLRRRQQDKNAIPSAEVFTRWVIDAGFKHLRSYREHAVYVRDGVEINVFGGAAYVPRVSASVETASVRNVEIASQGDVGPEPHVPQQTSPHFEGDVDGGRPISKRAARRARRERERQEEGN